MSDKEEETILEAPPTDEVLADLDKEQPKPLLLLVAVILGSLSLILSLVAIMQTKDDPSPSGPKIENLSADGSVGLDNILSRLEAIEQKSSQISAVPSEFNAEGGSVLESEVVAIRNELGALRAKVDNLRLGMATNGGSRATTTSTTNSAPPPAPPPAAPPPATLTVPPGGKLHILKSGETLSALSKMYGVTLAKIQAANQGLDARKLQIGAKIIIPAP